MSRIPHCLDSWLRDGGKVDSPTRRPHFNPPGRFLIPISVRGWVNCRAIVRLEGLDKFKNWKKKSNDLIGNRIRDLPACSIVELSLSYGRRSVDQFVLISGSRLGPLTRFYPYPFFSDNFFVLLHVGRRLWREDGSVTYSAIADLSGHWGPITIHYRLIWDCVLSSSPLTTRRDCGGGILTRLHTGSLQVISTIGIYHICRQLIPLSVNAVWRRTRVDF
jgi:hypothetical protein